MKAEFKRVASEFLSEVRARLAVISRGRRLRSMPARRPPNNHSVRRINALSNRFPFLPRYLEVGLQEGKTFEQIRAATRVGVEPYPRFSRRRLPRNSEVYVGTSDLFFDSCQSKFDLVFLDGLHEANQTYRDLIHALRFLEPGGVIMVDDVVPLDEPSSLPSLRDSDLRKRELGINHPFWYGDVYKVLGVIIELHSDLDLVLIGDTPEHIQALVWRANSQTVVSAHPNAERAISNWTYSDFFPASLFLESLEILSEEEAIDRVPVNQKGRIS